MSDALHALWHALSIGGAMAWEILWALILGFLLSAIVESVVKKDTVVRATGKDSPKGLANATRLGAVSSSCSYAAVALARSLFRKGANFTSAFMRMARSGAGSPHREAAPLHEHTRHRPPGPLGPVPIGH